MAADRNDEAEVTPTWRILTPAQQQARAERIAAAAAATQLSTPQRSTPQPSTDTAPIELLIPEDDADDRSDDRVETARRLRSDSRDPYDLLANLAYVVHDERRARRLGPELEQQVILAIHRQDKRTKKIEFWVRVLKWAGAALAPLVLAAALAALKTALSLAEERGADRVRLDLLFGQFNHQSPAPGPGAPQQGKP